jgi:hypothetical protein
LSLSRPGFFGSRGAEFRPWRPVASSRVRNRWNCRSSRSGVARARIPAEILAYARAAFPNAAAQTRMVSVARNRLDPRKSCATFKGIFCHDISEFESYMPSHAVGLSQVRGKHFPAPTAPAAWVAGPAAQIRICSNGKKLSGSCQYIFQARLAVARVVWLCFAHVERHFDQYR